MKVISAALLWNFIVVSGSLKIDLSSPLEGKVKGLTYDENEGENLQYLATLRDSHNEIVGTTAVVNEYFTVTARRCLDPEWTKKNDYGFAHVSTLLDMCYIDMIFEDSAYNNLAKPKTSFTLGFDLAVIKLLTPVTVPVLKLYRWRPLHFEENTKFKLVVYTKDGPVALPLKLDSIISEEFEPKHDRVYTAEIEGCTKKQFDRGDFGGPVVVNNRLVGIYTLQKEYASSSNIYIGETIKAAITFTTIYDHSKFAQLILKFHGKTLKDIEDPELHNLFRDSQKPILF